VALSSMKKLGKSKSNKADIDFDFNLGEPEVQKLLAQFMSRMEDINDTTFESIKKILQTGYDEGSSLEDISDAINDEFKFINKVRSKRIAKTEMNGAVNGGNLLGYGQGGATHKEWISAFLPDSRKTHMDADNQPPIPIGEKFYIGGSQMMFPGDPAGLVEDVVNCYCSIIGFEA